MTVISWAEIALFHNVRKLMGVYPHLAHGNTTVTYRGKVKLHGSNAAVQCHPDGQVIPQSRTTELSETNDLAGFAKWVLANKSKWETLGGFVVFGEWCGPGIQKGVAVNQIPNKCFAVFAARHLSPGDDTLITDPVILQRMVEGIPDTYVLPWHGESITVNWTASDAELAAVTADINARVEAVEKCDPWVEATFGVKGTGEGIVFYPMGAEHQGNECFGNLCFKAKGEKHRVMRSEVAAQVSAEVVQGIDQFVAMVLTEARLEQGAAAVAPGGTLAFDKKLTGRFVDWVKADVQKEAQDELTAAGLDWEQVQKPLTAKARQWYLGKA